VTDIRHDQLAARWYALRELHAAASWLWPALVARLIAEGWNVDHARGHAARLKNVPEPPDWADADAIGEAVPGRRRWLLPPLLAIIAGYPRRRAARSCVHEGAYPGM
jgi:hypothetical protein